MTSRKSIMSTTRDAIAAASSVYRQTERAAEAPLAPAPINAKPGEPVANTRIRALQLAEYHGLIELFIGPVDPHLVKPTEQRYAYLPKGMTLDDLAKIMKRGGDVPTLEAAEVLPYCYGLGLASGLGKEFRYRDGIPEPK